MRERERDYQVLCDSTKKKKNCTKTHIGFSCGTEGELCWGNMIKVCCGVTLCNVTASHIQKQRTTTAPYKNTPRGVLQHSWRWKKRKNIDHLKATEYNLFVSLFFPRNFSWSVDLLWNGPSCHWIGRFEIHAANKGVVLPRQKLFISLAESCCWQEFVLLGWNKSSRWFQDNLPPQQTATWDFVKETHEKGLTNTRVCCWFYLLLDGGGGGWYEFLVLLYF